MGVENMDAEVANLRVASRRTDDLLEDEAPYSNGFPSLRRETSRTIRLRTCKHKCL